MNSLLTYKDILMYDFNRQLFSENEYNILLNEMKEKVIPKINDMKIGKKINFTEDRKVQHFSLRANDSVSWYKNEVTDVLNKIDCFVSKIHSGAWNAANGKKFKNIISIGIGGSYLGTEFFYNAIDKEKKMNLRLLANIDPFDLIKSFEGLNADETLVIVISKTFTTQETMVNANCVKEWLLKNISNYNENEIISKHMIAVSTNKVEVKNFGISEMFEFWDWVGGRYSVWSAVGILPLSLAFGFNVVKEILNGAQEADQHFFNEPIETNIPIHMGLITIDHVNRGLTSRAILPYSQALNRFPAHIQQVEMESNGKIIDANGNRIKKSGQVVFGEPGTNGQHSFYQLLHQGNQIIPCEFIGFCKQNSYYKQKEAKLSNHDELMCNFFAQADALFYGKNRDSVMEDGCTNELVNHKVFEGKRPSTLLLMNELNPFNLGFLLALYEHYIAVQGFYWNINSFDQWGVELGKQLAKKVKSYMEGNEKIFFNNSTSNLLKYYLEMKKQST